MLGAIAGDVIGSVYEQAALKTKLFPLFVPESCFTDDTVMTVAVADALLTDGNYQRAFHTYYAMFPRAGYGGQFRRWCQMKETQPYNSWGNGSAMRVSPVAYAFDTLEEVLDEAKRSAEVTHNHPEGVRGAQATALAVFFARQRMARDEIASQITARFGYDLTIPLKDVRPKFLFDVSCAGTVPWAIRSFIEADDYEDAVRNAISLGGDADTLACIAGAIAGEYYGVPEEIRSETQLRLDQRLLEVISRFNERYGL